MCNPTVRYRAYYSQHLSLIMPLTVSSNHDQDNLKMDCELCQEVVIYGDDYMIHLKEAHGIKKNFAKFLDKKIKTNGEKRKAEEEVINIDDDDDEEDTAMISQDEEETLRERDIPAEVKKMVEEKVSSVMRNLLAPLYDILAEYSEEDTAPPTSPFTSDLPEDEELLEEFNKISRAFDDLKFPEEVIRDLVGDQFSTLIERPELPVKNTGVSLPASRTPEKASVRQQPLPPATPSSSSSSSCSNTTLFFCPLSPCRFKTTKEGMKEGAAAKHLKEVHKVTGAMMKKEPSGTYKFRKVKQEQKI